MKWNEIKDPLYRAWVVSFTPEVIIIFFLTDKFILIFLFSIKIIMATGMNAKIHLECFNSLKLHWATGWNISATRVCVD